MEVVKPMDNDNRKGASGVALREAENREVSVGGGCARSSVEAPVMGVERRGAQNSLKGKRQPAKGMIVSAQTKSQPITKRQVWDAWKRIRTGGKATGVDKLTISEVDANPRKYLYPLWNRLASGCYFPPPVREVSIPKSDGKSRKLGIPTILDRVAQEVIRAELEKIVEPKFHPSSFGYRPGRSAHDALEQCAKNCWERWFVVDLDIKGFFDNLDHNAMMSILRKHTGAKHILMYCERWLKAPMQSATGEQVNRHKGTPQGGVISPLLANLYLHEAFDLWLSRTQPLVVFERYADDIVIHTRSPEQSKVILDKVRRRLQDFHLELNQEKSKTVYCWRTARFHKEPKGIPVCFDFLGFTFKPRRCARADGAKFWGFRPGISRKSEVRIIRSLKELAFQQWSGRSIEDLARFLQPRIRGWLNYYGRFQPSLLNRLFWNLNRRLIKWARKKYKLLTFGKGFGWLKRVYRSNPKQFAHWEFGFGV